MLSGVALPVSGPSGMTPGHPELIVDDY